ncbi:MAG TPA: NAD(P)/FAD-dependent oxidoreductase [Flavobacterium sp.]|nr:NAD(P)/FAD-dependent oxidoreductase [Flavobacterium sp.]
MPQRYDVIIIGGSSAGLSAAMTLGRSLRKVLVIDSNEPCNIQTPRSHNFITQDGKAPAEIAAFIKQEVLKYPTITFIADKAINAIAEENGFTVETKTEKFQTENILLATGLTDMMPDIPGFAECWGISILHCPYCHGYEVRGQETAILANGEAAYHLGILINHWTQKITALTNGISELRNEEAEKLSALNINVIENEIEAFVHTDGQLEKVKFKDGTYFPIKVMYASIPFRQQSDLAEKLGCKFNAHGHIDIDAEQRTSITGVYAAGDNTAQHRAISVAAASGTRAGFAINAEMILK